MTITDLNKKYDGKETLTIKYDNKYYIRRDCYIWFFGSQKEFIEYIKKEWLENENTKMQFYIR